MHRRDAADGSDDRNRCLASTTDHADVRRIEVRAHVDDGDQIRSRRRRREIHHLHPAGSRDLAVADVRPG